MEQTLEFYEQKIISDQEFPVEMQRNRIGVKGAYFAPHWHEHVELHYLVSGRARYQLDKEMITAEQGDLVIVNSNVLHAGYCGGIPAEEIAMIFEMEMLSRELAEKNVIFQPIIRGNEEIQRIMRMMQEEAEKMELGWKLVCKGGLLQLMTWLARNGVQEMLSDSASVKRKKKLERLNTVNWYIEQHYMEPISNVELADLVHLSEDRFNHLFKEGTGLSPLQYINEIRLKKAYHMLKKGTFTASEVADAVGFSDYNHFGRLYKRYFGCTPLETREKNSGQQKI